MLKRDQKGKAAMEAEQSIIINRPIEEVFDVSTCYERCVVWRGPVVGAEKTSNGPVTVGTTYRHKLSLLGKTIETEPVITAWEPPHRAEFVNRKGPAIYKSAFILEPDGEGTKLTTCIQLEFGSIFTHIPDGIVKQIAMRQHKADLETLKELMENGTEIKV
jgi:carbon monoxide dehydrogenase subunit G